MVSTWNLFSARRNGIDLHARQVLAMAPLAMRVLAALFLERDDFIGPVLDDDLSRNRRAVDQRRSDLAFGRQDLRKADGRTRIARKSIDIHNVAGRDSILFAAGADHRVHGRFLTAKVEHSRNARPAGSRAL